MERKKGFAYNHRNMALRYVFLVRVQGVHIPAESLARLVFLGSKRSRRATIKEESECGSACIKKCKAHFVVQYWQEYLKEIAEKRKTAVISQADQRENRRFFGL